MEDFGTRSGDDFTYMEVESAKGGKMHFIRLRDETGYAILWQEPDEVVELEIGNVLEVKCEIMRIKAAGAGPLSFPYGIVQSVMIVN